MRPFTFLRMLVLAAACGCASLPEGLRIRAPDAELERVRVTGIGLSGGSLALDFQVLNPNAFDVSTTRIELTLDLEGTRFGNVSLAQGIVLASGARVPLEVPLTFTWSGVGAGARGLLETGSVAYGSTLRLFVNTPIGERSFDIHGDGVVPIEVLLR